MNHPKRFLSIAELAERWDAHQLEIHKAVHAGAIRILRLKPRGKIRIPITEVERLEQGAFVTEPK